MIQTDQRAFYSVAQAAQVLGVSRTTVWRWIEADKLPAYRVGPKNIRIRKEDLDRLVQPARSTRKEESPTMERVRFERPSQKEIARRKALVAQILALRDELKIAPLTSADLTRKVRKEEHQSYGKPRRAR